MKKAPPAAGFLPATDTRAPTVMSHVSPPDDTQASRGIIKLLGFSDGWNGWAFCSQSRCASQLRHAPLCFLSTECLNVDRRIMFIAAKKFAQTNRVGKRLPGFAVLGVSYDR